MTPALFCPFIFGIARRIYGADKGDFPANRLLCFGLPLGAATFFALAPAWYFLPLLIAAFYFGMSLASYADYWHMRSVKDWAWMAFNGFKISILPSLALWVISNPLAYLFLTFGVISLPVGYWIGWHLPTINKSWMNTGTEWGELLSAFLWGISIPLFVLWR